MARRITLSFLKTEQASGLILVLAAAMAIALANSAWADRYFAFVGHPITVQVGGFRETLTVADWVKHGLMAVFFFMAGLEIKFEILRGELSNPRSLALPLLAAAGGMVVPTGIYLFLNGSHGGAPHGWPTPVATDIAFALAALAVAAPRLPPALRTFLLTLAIADDLGAVALIAALFTTYIHPAAVLGAAAALAAMALLGRLRRPPNLIYGALFVVIWAFALKSGINTSIAGVLAAMTIPIEPRRPGHSGVLHDFMESLHPYVAFMILPMFAFTAAGFSIRGLTIHELFSPVALGVALGLFVGKQVGVFAAAAIALGFKLARRPTGSTWIELYGCALLCGVGFTLSLYLGALAFDPKDVVIQSEVRLGVLAGSLASALAGMAVLRWSQSRTTD